MPAVSAYTAAALIAAFILQTFLPLGDHKAFSFSDAQRKLLGFGPSKRPAGPPTGVQPRPAGIEPLAVTPPSRTTRPMLQPVSTPGEAQPGQLRTAGSKGSARNVTPDQLQRMIQELEDHVDAAQAPQGAADFGAFPGGAAVQAGVTPSAATNKYRPSAMSVGLKSAPTQTDGVPRVVPAQRASIMRELGVTEDTVTSGIENLREWFASDVLQPLQTALQTAHDDLITGATQLGFTGVRLTPLIDLGKN